MRGAREVGFTVLSISLSLIAVFMPILLMGGIVGRLFREFAVTLSIAILISLVISLTTTPMMCALFLRGRRDRAGPQRRGRACSTRAANGYGRTLDLGAAPQPAGAVLILSPTIALNVYLFVHRARRAFSRSRIPAGCIGALQADQSISFQAMQRRSCGR